MEENHKNMDTSKYNTRKTSSPLGRAGVGLKICGMKHNLAEVATLGPDYLGFIFWEPSARYFEGEIEAIPSDIEKIGVFVDADISYVLDQIEKYDLQGVQLHGNETPEYCKELVEYTGIPDRFLKPVRCIKVFSIKEEFDFSVLKAYEEVCDYFLFDTKGELPGGNGYVFDWSVLKDYPSTKPYFLSGGIGLENIEQIKKFLQTPESKYCHVLDVNSKFEDRPGLKNIEKLEEFIKELELRR